MSRCKGANAQNLIDVWDATEQSSWWSCNITKMRRWYKRRSWSAWKHLKPTKLIPYRAQSCQLQHRVHNISGHQVSQRVFVAFHNYHSCWEQVRPALCYMKKLSWTQAHDLAGFPPNLISMPLAFDQHKLCQMQGFQKQMMSLLNRDGQCKHDSQNYDQHVLLVMWPCKQYLLCELWQELLQLATISQQLRHLLTVMLSPRQGYLQ